MSKHHMGIITCPKCGKESDFMILDSINTTLDPEMKDKVRTGEAFIFQCPKPCYALRFLRSFFHTQKSLLPDQPHLPDAWRALLCSILRKQINFSLSCHCTYICLSV